MEIFLPFWMNNFQWTRFLFLFYSGFFFLNFLRQILLPSITTLDTNIFLPFFAHERYTASLTLLCQHCPTCKHVISHFLGIFLFLLLLFHNPLNYFHFFFFFHSLILFHFCLFVILICLIPQFLHNFIFIKFQITLVIL